MPRLFDHHIGIKDIAENSHAKTVVVNFDRGNEQPQVRMRSRDVHSRSNQLDRHSVRYFREDLTSYVSPTATISDTILYESSQEASRKFYLPQYRIAEETIDDQRRFRISLSQSRLQIYLERVQPAQILSEIQQSQAQSMVHELLISIRFVELGKFTTHFFDGIAFEGYFIGHRLCAIYPIFSTN